ncbi:hypothetical protein D3C80_1742420 [compost metagenome]
MRLMTLFMDSNTTRMNKLQQSVWLKGIVERHQFFQRSCFFQRSESWFHVNHACTVLVCQINNWSYFCRILDIDLVNSHLAEDHVVSIISISD